MSKPYTALTFHHLLEPRGVPLLYAGRLARGQHLLHGGAVGRRPGAAVPGVRGPCRPPERPAGGPHRPLGALAYTQQYLDIVAQRIQRDPAFLEQELARETVEGTATYVGIRASQLTGYDFGVMYFDNVKDVPFPTCGIRSSPAGWTLKF